MEYATPSVITTPTAQEVYSPQNVASTLTSPAKAPNLSDPYGLYDYYMNSSDIVSAKSNVQSIQGQINQTNQALRTTTRALEGQNENAMGGTGASINLIGKQVGRARQLTADEMAGLSEQQLAAQSYLSSLQSDATNRYNIAQTERTQLQDLIRQTGGQAGISYADSYETAVQKTQKYVEKEEKKAKEEAEEAEKKAYKKALQQALLEMGSSYKGLSTNELEKKLKKKNKSAIEAAEAQAKLEFDMKIDKHNADIANINSLISNRGKEDEGDYDKNEKALYSDVDKWKSKMRSGSATWGDAWSSIQRKYGFDANNQEDVEIIDALLGVEFRDKYSNLEE